MAGDQRAQQKLAATLTETGWLTAEGLLDFERVWPQVYRLPTSAGRDDEPRAETAVALLAHLFADQLRVVAKRKLGRGEARPGPDALSPPQRAALQLLATREPWWFLEGQQVCYILGLPSTREDLRSYLDIPVGDVFDEPLEIDGRTTSVRATMADAVDGLDEEETRDAAARSIAALAVALARQSPPAALVQHLEVPIAGAFSNLSAFHLALEVANACGPSLVPHLDAALARAPRRYVDPNGWEREATWSHVCLWVARATLDASVAAPAAFAVDRWTFDGFMDDLPETWTTARAALASLDWDTAFPEHVTSHAKRPEPPPMPPLGTDGSEVVPFSLATAPDRAPTIRELETIGKAHPDSGAWWKVQSPRSMGLWTWGKAIGASHPALGVKVALAAAKAALPTWRAAAERDAPSIRDLVGGMGPGAESGETPAAQLSALATYLAKPSAATKEELRRTIDQTRQLRFISEEFRAMDAMRYAYALEASTAAVLSLDDESGLEVAIALTTAAEALVPEKRGRKDAKAGKDEVEAVLAAVGAMLSGSAADRYDGG